MRIGKGLYYRPRQTAFGPSKPNPSQHRSLSILGQEVFPARVAAANLLGFTTQQAAKLEIATTGLSLPRMIVGQETIIHTRRPESWKELSKKDVAILDFLRQRGITSELSSKKTVNKLLEHFQEAGQFKRLLKTAPSEPPRVRAILGAIGQELGYSDKLLSGLHDSLNPLSRFDFSKICQTMASKGTKTLRLFEHQDFFFFTVFIAIICYIWHNQIWSTAWNSPISDRSSGWDQA